MTITESKTVANDNIMRNSNRDQMNEAGACVFEEARGNGKIIFQMTQRNRVYSQHPKECKLLNGGTYLSRYSYAIFDANLYYQFRSQNQM